MNIADIEKVSSLRKIAATRETAEKIRQVLCEYNEESKKINDKVSQLKIEVRSEQEKVALLKTLHEALDFLKQLKQEQEEALANKLTLELNDINEWKRAEIAKMKKSAPPQGPLP